MVWYARPAPSFEELELMDPEERQRRLEEDPLIPEQLREDLLDELDDLDY